MRITTILVILAILVFLYTAFFVKNHEAFFNQYGFSGDNMLSRPYVFVTSIFLHGSLEHLLSNVLIWLFFGLAVESELGKKKMLMIFFLGAVAGDLFSLLIYPFSEIGIGASAGIFALIGVGMIVRPIDLSLYPFIMPVPLALLGVFYALYNGYAFFAGIDPNVSYIAHFGGLIIGLIFGIRYRGIKKSLIILVLSLIIIMALPFMLKLLL